MIQAKSRYFCRILFLIFFGLLIFSCREDVLYPYDKNKLGNPIYPDSGHNHLGYGNQNRQSYDNSRSQPYSRGYSNPYNFPPHNYYQYYDSDQYYVPPTGYNNVEPQYPQSGDPLVRH